MNEEEIDIVTRTLYGEAEREDEEDVIAIAWVIKNRVMYRNWPDSYSAVCLQPWQFSCWNQNDSNRAKILAVSKNDLWYKFCREIAIKVMKGEIPDPTVTSTHYYATWLKKPPAWARGHDSVYATPAGRYTHLFFNDIDTPPPKNSREALDQQKPLSESKEVKAAIGGGLLGAGVIVKETMDLIDRSRSWFDTNDLIGYAVGFGVIAVAVYIGVNRLRARRQGER